MRFPSDFRGWSAPATARVRGDRPHSVGLPGRLAALERAILLLAVFLCPFIQIRPGEIFFTVSDGLFCVSFSLLLLAGRVPLAPIGRSTPLFCASAGLLAFSLLASSFVSGDPARGLIVAGQYLFAYLLLLFVLVRDDLVFMNRLVLTFVTSLVLIDLHGILTFVTSGYVSGPGKSVVTGAGRLATTLGNPNLAGQLNALTVPMLLYLWVSEFVSGPIAALMLVVMGVTVIMASSNSGLIAFACSLFVFTAMLLNRRILSRLLLLATITAATLYFGGTSILPQAFQRRVLGAIVTGDVSEAGTFLDRFALMREAFNVIVARGIVLVGIGADQFRVISVQGAPVHNMYLLLLVEGGLLALLGWLAFLLTGICLGIIARFRQIDPPAAAMVIAVLSTFAVVANFTPHMYGRHWTAPLILALGVIMARLGSGFTGEVQGRVQEYP